MDAIKFFQEPETVLTKLQLIVSKQHTKPRAKTHKNHCWFPENGSRWDL